jgi:hypothetical protein
MAKTGAELLAEQRAELKAQGKTTRQLGRERIYFALDWVYRWGWSSPSIIDMTTGAMRRGLCAKLLKAGLLTETKTAAGRILEDLPSKIVTLSEDGLAYLEKYKDDQELLDYPLNPYKVNQSLLRHDLLAQRATLKNLLDDKIQEFRTPRELAAKSQPGVKQPDVLWINEAGRRIAVEVELTAKFGRKLDDFVWSIVLSLSQVGDRAPLFDRCMIVTDSDAIVRRYMAAFKPGAIVNRWIKDTQSHFRVERKVEVPAHIKGLVLCKKID